MIVYITAVNNCARVGPTCKPHAARRGGEWISAVMIAIGSLMARNLNLGTLVVITTFNPVKPKFWTLTYETVL